MILSLILELLAAAPVFAEDVETAIASFASKKDGAAKIASIASAAANIAETAAKVAGQGK